MSAKSSTPKKQPRLIVLSAPSGGGKTTLCKKLLDEFQNIELSISATTRPKRPNENEGEHYFFLTKEAFKKKIAAGVFAEWAEVHGNYYGTPKDAVTRALSSGKNVLFDIDVQGALSLQKSFGNQTLLIFILPPSMEELEKRLRSRGGDSAAAIETRLKNAYSEIKWSPKFHYRIINESLESAYTQLRSIIEKECP